MSNPSPDEIRAARSAAGLTQTEAAALIGKSLKAWQNWESAIGSGEHRKMDAELWEWWKIKACTK